MGRWHSTLTRIPYPDGQGYYPYYYQKFRSNLDEFGRTKRGTGPVGVKLFSIKVGCTASSITNVWFVLYTVWWSQSCLHPYPVNGITLYP